MYVIPAPNPLAGEAGHPARLKVRDPDLRDHLPDEGREVPPSEYWTRRIRDKDVLVGTPPAPATKDPKPASPASPAVSAVADTETTR